MSTPSLGRLDDYTSGTMPPDEATAFEEEMFSSPDAPNLRFIDRTRDLLAWLGARGGLGGGGTAKDVETLRAAGYRVHLVEFQADGEPIKLEPWGNDIDVVVFRTLIDVRSYEEVECQVETSAGVPIKTFRGIEGDPVTGNVYAICAPPLAQMAYGRERRISRMTGVRNGRRETIAVFDSSPA